MPTAKKATKKRATARKKTTRCWNGYEPVPGKKAYSKGSCRPKKKSDAS